MIVLFLASLLLPFQAMAEPVFGVDGFEQVDYVTYVGRTKILCQRWNGTRGEVRPLMN